MPIIGDFIQHMRKMNCFVALCTKPYFLWEINKTWLIKWNTQIYFSSKGWDLMTLVAWPLFNFLKFIILTYFCHKTRGIMINKVCLLSFKSCYQVTQYSPLAADLKDNKQTLFLILIYLLSQKQGLCKQVLFISLHKDEISWNLLHDPCFCGKSRSEC